MKPSLPSEPAFGSAPIEIPSNQFNPIRLALLRLGHPLSIVLGKRGLEFRLTHDAWVCYDPRIAIGPSLAWTDFEVGRGRLDAPVPARVHFYNSYGKLFLYTALPEVADRLMREVKECGGRTGRILAYRH